MIVPVYARSSTNIIYGREYVWDRAVEVEYKNETEDAGKDGTFGKTIPMALTFFPDTYGPENCLRIAFKNLSSISCYIFHWVNYSLMRSRRTHNMYLCKYTGLFKTISKGRVER